ncbi:MAG TPA: iron-sulfur cluster assembly scaffold protein, partial [bacterium]|nr:iron-sulfur cluster assembly scaffold protein [bacterium]
PRNFGVLGDATHHRHEANPACGDVIDVYLRVHPDGLIQTVSFTGRGCVISQAATSLVLEVTAGKSVAEVLAMCPEDVVGLLGVQPGPMRMNCALLVLRALQKAVC